MMTSAGPLARILLYVEASETSISAARYAIVLAKAHGTVLHTVYVVNENMLSELTRANVFLKEEETDLRRDLEEDGRRYLQYVERLAAAKHVNVSTRLRRGVVHTEMAEEAAEFKATIIILGELEEHLSRREPFYHEAETILWTAKCPVLVVKGETTAEDLYDSIE